MMTISWREQLLAGLCVCVAAAPWGRAEPTPPAGFVALFNGRDLQGWKGDEKVWRVVDGVIVGAGQLANNEFLAFHEEFGDFELRLMFRLKDGHGNSGVQIRSQRIPNHHEMIGYQADIGENYWGCLYDESRRRKVLAGPPADWTAKLNKGDWHEYRIHCEGPRVRLFIDGEPTVDYTEADEAIPRAGLIALQVHSSKTPIQIEFRDIFLRKLMPKD